MLHTTTPTTGPHPSRQATEPTDGNEPAVLVSTGKPKPAKSGRKDAGTKRSKGKEITTNRQEPPKLAF